MTKKTDKSRKTQSNLEKEYQVEEGGSDAAATPAGEVVHLEQVIEGLTIDLAEKNRTVDELKDSLLRERADFDNARKRLDRDAETNKQQMRAGIIKKYLAVQDDMERALAHMPAEGSEGAWAEGIKLIYQKLVNLIASEGLQPLANAGDTFDPNLHEAISLEEHPDLESNQIIEVTQQGYKLGDRVVRPAQVRVAR